MRFRFRGKKSTLIVILLAVFLFSANFAYADVVVNESGTRVTDAVDQGWLSRNIAQFLSWIALNLASFAGWLMTFVMKWVQEAFKLTTDDLDPAGLTMGWQTMRDVCNMFFILILLIIAFATILRMENYPLKRLLPKLLIMAVLINFSKTICFLLIDLSQIVMLTFANAFTSATEGNFVQMLGLQFLNDLREYGDWELESWNLLAAILLALTIIVLTLIVMIMFLVVLVSRIIMFWVLIVLSPVAFVASVLPSTSQYASRWWGEFSRYLILGPVLAFFTWLSLTISLSDEVLPNLRLSSLNQVQVNAAISDMGSWDNMSRFIIGIGLLIATLTVSRGVGGIGAGMGMAMAQNIKHRGTALGRKIGQRIGQGTWNLGKGTAKNVAKTSGRIGILGAGGALKWMGTDKKGGAKTGILGEAAHKTGAFMGGWAADMKKTRDTEKWRKRQRTLERLGMGENAMKTVKDLGESRAGRAIKHAATAAGAVGAGLVAGPAGWIAGGSVVAARLLAGKFKRKQEKGKEDRESRKSVIEETKKKEIEGVDRGHAIEVKALDLQLKHDNIGVRSKLLDQEHDINKDNAERKKNDDLRDIQVKLDDGLISKEEHAKEKTNIENKHGERVANIDKDHDKIKSRILGPKLSQEEHDQKLRLLEHNRNIKIRQVSAPHDAEISKIDKEKVGWIDKQMEKYQPNRVTIEAAKLGSQESTIARQRVETLARGEGAHKFHASDYYSAGGLTSQQKKFYDTLSDTSRESVNAIKSMVDNMQKMVGNERNYGRSELDAIRSLKQGLAARKKGGADMSKLEGVVNVINKVDTGGADGNETVQGFESKVVAGSK